jgi:predicted transcriptional regulator of viral defense system
MQTGGASLKYYSDLLAIGCFTRKQVCAITGNYNTAGTLLKSYLAKGYIRKVKRNLYVAVNLADNEPAISKFRIGSMVTGSAYVSHHAAFEYYGYANQVSYQVEVSSETPFSTFDFSGNTYAYFDSRINDGVSTTPDGVRVTDTERTILDGIHDFEKVMGLEELLRCIALIPAVKEERLLSYLALYGKQVMYQKTGYILSHFRRELNLSETFFETCAAHIGKSTRYLTTDRSGVYDKEWMLIVPNNLPGLISKGVTEDADI